MPEYTSADAPISGPQWDAAQLHLRRHVPPTLLDASTYTPVVADEVIIARHATSTAITLDPEVFEVGKVLSIIRGGGAGPVAIAAGIGLAFQNAAGTWIEEGSFSIAAQLSGVYVQFLETDEGVENWIPIGDHGGVA